MSDKKVRSFDMLGLALALFLCLSFVLTGWLLYHDFYGAKNHTAYADSSFNANLLSYSDYTGLNFNYTGSSFGSYTVGVPYADNILNNAGFCNIVGDSEGLTVSRTTTGGFTVGFFGFLYDFSLNTTYTITFNVLSCDNSNSGLPLRLHYYDGTSVSLTPMLSISQLSTTGVVSYTFTTNSSDTFNCIYITPQKAVSITFDKVKLEVGSTFTGWSNPLQDAYDEGYEDGYDAGKYDNSRFNDGFVGNNLLIYNFTEPFNNSNNFSFSTGVEYSDWNLTASVPVDYYYDNIDRDSLFSFTSFDVQITGTSFQFDNSQLNDIDSGTYTFTILYDYHNSGGNFSVYKLLTVTFNLPVSPPDTSNDLYLVLASSTDADIGLSIGVYYNSITSKYYLFISGNINDGGAFLTNPVK